MLRATGRYADAWLPDLSFHPEEYASGLEVVRTAASDAGRDPLSILPAHLSYIITARRADDIEEALSSPATKSLALLAPRTSGRTTECNIRSVPTSAASRIWCHTPWTLRQYFPL